MLLHRRQLLGGVLEFTNTSAGFCRLQVPGFTEIVKLLYDATRGQEDKIEWILILHNI